MARNPKPLRRKQRVQRKEINAEVRHNLNRLPPPTGDGVADLNEIFKAVFTNRRMACLVPWSPVLAGETNGP